jgi:hypothetical protein
MIKYNFLNGFIERLNTHEIIRSLAFFSLYNEWFLEVSRALHDEILENLSLTTTDKKIYLKYVKKQASEKVVYQNDNKFLEKWIKIYQLEESKFPFIDNEEVQMLLDTDVKDPVLDNKKKKLCTNIQMDFYCHAAMVEKYKMIDFIDELLVLEIKDQQSVVPGEEIVVDFEANTKPKKLETTSQSGLNDYTKSTIEDCLFSIKNDINPDQYEILVDTLYTYFTTGKFPILEKKIMFKSVNKKRVAWALKEAYRNLKIDKLSLEYLKFAKDNINLFEKVQFDSEDFWDSNLYKYFNTNPDK